MITSNLPGRMTDPGKFNVLGVQVDAVDYAGAVARIIGAAHQRQGLSASAVAVHGVMTGVMDKAHRFRLNHFDLLVPDGQPVRWALNWLYRTNLTERVYGPQLMLDTCREAAENNLPIYLFGSDIKLLERLADNLKAKFPELQIAGMRPSKFRTLDPAEWDELVCEVRESGAAIMFVGLGCPRQEVFAYEARDEVSMPILAVGAAFNFHSGDLPQAPSWIQRRGLEWFYRFVQEPLRLWKRYLLLNPAYLFLLALQAVGLKRLTSQQDDQPQSQILYG